jgi:hypothetical protein
VREDDREREAGDDDDRRQEAAEVEGPAAAVVVRREVIAPAMGEERVRERGGDERQRCEGPSRADDERRVCGGVPGRIRTDEEREPVRP